MTETMTKNFTMGKVDAARHEKNLWKRRACSAEIALKKIGGIFSHADEEHGADGAKADSQLLEEIWEIHQDWIEASDSQSTTPIKSMTVKAYIYPLTKEERMKAIDALEDWDRGDGSFMDGVDAVLEAVASLRDPATQRGPGL